MSPMQIDRHKKTETSKENKDIAAENVTMFLKMEKGGEMPSGASFGINMFMGNKAIVSWQKNLDYPKERSEGKSTR